MTSPAEAVPAGGAPAARIIVKNLTVSATATGAEVVQDVSLSVAPGEILGVVGESGSGKTTLGLAMIGHTRRGLKITSGEIMLDGTDLRALSADKLRELRGSAMAYVPQDPGTALNPARRIGPQLREALTVHGRGKEEVEERISELLREVGLQSIPNLLNVYPHQLSGGQQQRVAIAMAFACRPSLIVLDEPTTGLDVSTQRTVLETIAGLCESYGVAAVYVTHDVMVVGELAHRVVVVYSGRVVEDGFTEDVFRNPSHPYTRGLLRAVPSPDRAQRLIGMDGVPPRPGQRPPGCSFAPRCPVKVERCTHELPALAPAGAHEHWARCLLVGQVAEREPATVIATEITGPTVQEAAAAAAVAAGALEPVLRVDELNGHYGTRQVLFGINIAVPPNSCVAVVGESGSGKTTLARCLAGLHSSWDGDIRYTGKELTPGIKKRSKEVLQGVQYIFQNPYASLNPRRTIGGLVSQPLEQFTDFNRRERDQRVAQAIKSVHLPLELMSRYPDQLSGGERQRVAIARAIVVSPRLLICDEVTSALDVSVQAAVVEMLRRLQGEQSLSMLFITHNLALVRNIATEVIVMNLGHIVESGPVAEVLDNPQAEYTRHLLEDVPKFSDVGSTGV
jgi:peptide/nickel transport system ATP-binding protein